MIENQKVYASFEHYLEYQIKSTSRIWHEQGKQIRLIKEGWIARQPEIDLLRQEIFDLKEKLKK